MDQGRSFAHCRVLDKLHKVFSRLDQSWRCSAVKFFWLLDHDAVDGRQFFALRNLAP